MASATLPPNLDLSTLTTSAALFSASPSSTFATTSSASERPHPQYTLPQIRAVHAALQARAGNVAARLRDRVGGSYRDLLGTADAIVAMRDDMDEVLAVLGRMGGRCGRGVVADKVAGLKEFVGSGESSGGGGGGVGGGVSREGLTKGGLGGEEKGVAARQRLLEGVLLALREGLRRESGKHKKNKQSREAVGQAARGERLLVAARLYVLGRLLVKSLAGHPEVEPARKSLETAHRARLTRSIDAVLRRGGERAMREGDVLRALAAYSLATSSGARDVLAHFLVVRAQAIASTLGAGDNHDDDDDDDGEEARAARGPKDVLKALALYTKTLQDVQTLVPLRLTEALVALTRERLLENASLNEMEGLRLDIYKRWCGDEIQFYTPFIRHDDLDGQHARETLADWADKGSQVLLHGLERALQGMGDFKAIVELRTSILRLWIAEGGKARGFDPSVMLDQLRGSVNKHMLRVLEAKVAKLRLVGSEVSSALEAWREGIADRHQSLWDVGSFDTDLSNGAVQFTHDVVSRLYGRNDAVSKAVTSYKSWFRVTDDVGQVVDQLRRQRWDNDVDEVEDEETIEERQRQLSKDDPALLRGHVNRLLVEAFERLDTQLTTLWNAVREGPNNGAVAMYFLRLLRDIRANLPEIDAVKGFGLSAVPSLHEALAAAVVVSPLIEFATVALTRRTVVGRGLWEGEPALPGSPSPGIFRFLRNLTIAMSDAGADLWNPTAVSVLKRQLGTQISKAWLEALGSLETARDAAPEGTAGREAEDHGPGDGDSAESAQASPELRDLLVQWLLDVYYLRLFFGSQPASEDLPFRQLVDAVRRKLGLKSTVEERLVKASQEYFKKTGLLFGLLT